MPFVTCTEDLFDRHINGLPFGSAAAKTLHSLLASNIVCRLHRNYMRNDPTVTSDCYGLAILNHSEKFSPVLSGFSYSHR